MELGGRVERFEVLAPLTGDGAAAVFHARDSQLERDVAIKLVTFARGSSADLLKDETSSSDALLREARMMARLSHPNLVPVYEVGRLADAVFLVMEHVDGTALSAWAAGKSDAELRDVLVQAARGLAAAHACDIVHGELKPEHVVIGRDGRVRVMGFGLRRWRRALMPSKVTDVHAFCAMARELFAGGDEPAIIAAGLAADPPAFDAIVAALGRGPSRRWRWVGASCAVLAVGALYSLFAPSAVDECTLATAERWTPAREQALRHAMPVTTDFDRDRLDSAIEMIEETQAAIDTRFLAVCREREQGRITVRQATAVQACLSRRQLELVARVDDVTAYSPGLAELVERARVPDIRDCDELAVAAVPSDVARGEALYGRLVRRLVALERVVHAQRIAPAAAIAVEATVLGEQELAAKATLSVGMWSLSAGKLGLADVYLERAYAQGVELRSLHLQALAVASRSRTARKAGDANAALSLALVAANIVERDTIAPHTRARVYAELGRSALDRNDPQAALEHLDKAIVLLARDRYGVPKLAANLRLDRLRTLERARRPLHELALAADENAQWTAITFGEQSPAHALALDSLSRIRSRSGELLDAVAIQQRAVAVLEAFDPRDPRVALLEGNLAGALQNVARYEQAGRMYREELVEAEHNELVRAFIPTMVLGIGYNACAIGRCDEGYAELERALELGVSQWGASHAHVVRVRETLLEVQLATGRLRDASVSIESIERIGDAKARLLLRGSRAALARLRGHPERAEAEVRAALAASRGVELDAADRQELLSVLVDALVAQRKWHAARAAFERLERASTGYVPDDRRAARDVALARIEAGSGRLADGKRRARRALHVLVGFPLMIEAREAATELLAK